MLAGAGEQLEVRAAVVDVRERARLAQRGDDVVLGELAPGVPTMIEPMPLARTHSASASEMCRPVARRSRRARCRAGRRRSRRWRGSSRAGGRPGEDRAGAVVPVGPGAVAPGRVGEGRQLVVVGPVDHLVPGRDPLEHDRALEAEERGQRLERHRRARSRCRSACRSVVQCPRTPGGGRRRGRSSACPATGRGRPRRDTAAEALGVRRRRARDR